MSKKNMETNKKKGLFSFLKKEKKEVNIFEEELIMSPTKLAFQNFRHNKMAMVAVFCFLFIFLACMVLPIFMPLDITYSNATLQNLPPTQDFLDLPKAMQNNPKDISVGSGFGMGIDKDGKLHVWGHLNKDMRKLPKGIEKIKMKEVAAGADHLIALSEKGKIYTWGNKEFGLNELPPEIDWEQPKHIYGNYLYSVFLSKDGHAFVWGNQMTASVIPGLIEVPIKDVFLNATTGLGLTEDGKLLPMTSQSFAMTTIPKDVQGHVKLAALTNDRMYAVTDDGKLHGWGNPPRKNDVAMPTDLDGKIKKLVSGEFFVVALLNDGSLRAWGDNTLGQVSSLPKGKGFKDVYAGYHNGYAVKENGEVVGFGPKGFLMGTDALGRDVFRRLLFAGRMTMTVGAIAVIISALIGIIIGGISGFYSGPVDVVLMRFAEVVNSIPFLPLAMILSGILGSKISENQRIIMIMVILGVLSWPGMARLTRAQILSERKREFVTAAQALGIKESKIIFKHIVPNVINVILVSITLGFATCMLTESSLSFLGFGVQPPQPTWGNMLNGAQNSLVIGTYWWRWVFPSLVLAICTISINSIGDGLRDAIDPKSNGR